MLKYEVKWYDDYVCRDCVAYLSDRQAAVALTFHLNKNPVSKAFVNIMIIEKEKNNHG